MRCKGTKNYSLFTIYDSLFVRTQFFFRLKNLKKNVGTIHLPLRHNN